MDMTITFVPVPSLAQDEVTHTYPYTVGEPLPVVGEAVTFGDWTKPYRIVARSLHYIDDKALQIFFSYERDKAK